MGRRSPFGSVYRALGAQGDAAWGCRWTEGGRRRHATFATKREAVDFLAAKRMEAARARLLGAQPIAPVKVRAFTRQAVAHAKARGRSLYTVRAMRSILKRLRRKMGSRFVHHVTVADADAYVDGLLAKLASSTACQHLRVLRATWARGVKLRQSISNPWAEVAMPEVRASERPRLTVEELHALYAAMPTEVRPFVVFVGESGTRLRETLAMRWNWIDHAGRVVTIPGAARKNREPLTVYLTRDAEAALEAQRKRNPGLPGSLVFGYSTTYVGERFRRVADELGFPALTIHGLRHAMGNALADAGFTQRDIRDVLGHSSTDTTERYMGRTTAAARARIRDAIERVRHADTDESRRTSDSGT